MDLEKLVMTIWPSPPLKKVMVRTSIIKRSNQTLTTRRIMWMWTLMKVRNLTVTMSLTKGRTAHLGRIGQAGQVETLMVSRLLVKMLPTISPITSEIYALSKPPIIVAFSMLTWIYPNRILQTVISHQNLGLLGFADSFVGAQHLSRIGSPKCQIPVWIVLTPMKWPLNSHAVTFKHTLIIWMLCQLIGCSMGHFMTPSTHNVLITPETMADRNLATCGPTRPIIMSMAHIMVKIVISLVVCIMLSWNLSSNLIKQTMRLVMTRGITNMVVIL